MTPTRLTETSSALGQLIRDGRQVEALSAPKRAWLRHQLLSRVGERPWHQRRLVLATTFVVCVVLGAGLTKQVLLATAPPPGARLQLSPDARHAALTRDSVELSAGRLTVRTVTPFTVRTPRFEVVLARGAAAFEVIEGRSEVELFEGEGLARVEGRTVSLRVGEPLRSGGGDAASSAAPEPPPDARCHGATDCLEEVAQSDELSAQTALVRLGLNALAQGQFEHARRLSQTALERFPQSVLEPEMRLVRLQSLAQLGRDPEARVEGQWYLAHARGTPAAPGVSLLLGDLALRAGAFQDARAAYAATLTLEPGAELGAEAWYGVGLAEVELGHSAEADKAFRHALATSPNGPRRSDLERRLSGAPE